ncbi:hypothetical protein [Amycolatopsis solani]|uniref:hypothetical protein n=1 Tax=Amycolatopsis solani TaxID=3028615 RepID=UPI0025AF3D4C|nr:hypothetical protein [Amycolatopsis sp. MEP2-6]
MSVIPWMALLSSRTGTGPQSSALATVVRTIPLVMAVAGLLPALIICPFLTAHHRGFVLKVLAGLSSWAGNPPAERQGPDPLTRS